MFTHPLDFYDIRLLLIPACLMALSQIVIPIVAYLFDRRRLWSEVEAASRAAGDATPADSEWHEIRAA